MAPRRESQKYQKKKEKILQITTQLLLKKGGYAAISTTDICSAARLTRPTLYYYFGSKKNLLLSLHLHAIEQDLKPFLEKAAAIEDPLARLEYMVRTYTREIVCLHPELRFLIHDTLTGKDRYFRQVTDEWKKHYLLLRNTVVELQSQGRMSETMKPSWAALFLLGLTTWTTFWFDYKRREDIERIAESAAAFALQGLGAAGTGVPVAAT